MCSLHRCESGPASVGGGSPHGSPGGSGEAERPLLAHQTGRPVQDSEQPAPGRVERRGGDGGGGGGDGGGAQHAEPAAALWSSAGPGGEAATPGISGISGGECRQPAEEKVSLHPAEADGAQRQVPEALHPKTKCNLLTAQLHPVEGAALDASLLEAGGFYSFFYPVVDCAGPTPRPVRPSPAQTLSSEWLRN